MSDTERDLEWWQLPREKAAAPAPPPPVAPPSNPHPVPPRKVEPDEGTPERGKPDRRKSLILGAAGAALTGVILFAAMPDEGLGVHAGTAKPSVDAEAFLPPAGTAPQEAVTEDGFAPGAGATESVTPSGVVTLFAEPAGRGRTGALVKVTIRNDTPETVTVMPSMMQGDGRSAMVGEGTLAPGSRQVEPGETVEGTVEFASKGSPSQVVLLDLSGGVVAASAQN